MIVNSTLSKSINVTISHIYADGHLTKLPCDGELDGGGGVQQPRPRPRLRVAAGHTPHAAVLLAAEHLSLYFRYILDIFLFTLSDLYDVPVEVPGYGGGGAGGVGGAGGLQRAAEAVGGRHAPYVGAGGAGQRGHRHQQLRHGGVEVGRLRAHLAPGTWIWFKGLVQYLWN